MEELLNNLRDRFSKAVADAESAIADVNNITPAMAVAMRKRIDKISNDVTADINIVCDDVAVGDNDAIANHVMAIVDKIHEVERLPYLVKVWQFQHTS